MDTKIWFSYNLLLPQNIILLLIFFQSFKNIKTILSSKDTQKQAGARFGPQAIVCPPVG